MDESIVHKKLQSFKQNNRIPHIILYGSILSNKEDILVTFLKTVYANEKRFNENTMFVNCAHCKGIKFIREELKFFAKTNTQPDIPFKSIILLNGDHLTVDAQSALRRCIEQFSENTRFFIIVENKNKLLNPILSRFCEIFVPDKKKNVINNQYHFDENSEINFYLEKFEKQRDHVNSIEIIDTSAVLYDNGYSCLDVLEWINNSSVWNALEKANIGMFFSKIRSEYRSEKLLIVTILFYICNELNSDIKAKSFM